MRLGLSGVAAKGFLLWLCAMVCVVPHASAAIVINQTLDVGTGSLAGYQLFRFYAKLGAEEQAAGATGLQSVDFAVDVVNPLKFKFTNLNTHPHLDVDVFGDSMLTDPTTGYDPRTAREDIGTFVRVASPVDLGNGQVADDLSGWQAVTLEPGGTGKHLSSPANTESQIAQTFGNAKHFRVSGAVLAPNPPDTRAAFDQGALFATVVVQCTPVDRFTVSLAGERGAITNIQGFLCIPEPGALAVAGAVASTLFLRRGRRIGSGPATLP